MKRVISSILSINACFAISGELLINHYNNVTWVIKHLKIPCHMGNKAYQNTINSTLCSTTCWGQQQGNIKFQNAGDLTVYSTGCSGQQQSYINTLLDLCEGNPLVTGGFPSHKGPVMQKAFQCEDIILYKTWCSAFHYMCPSDCSGVGWYRSHYHIEYSQGLLGSAPS